MKRILVSLIAGLALLASPAYAQNAASGSPRVQGTPDGYGDPVQVTVVNSAGTDESASRWSYSSGATPILSNTTTAVTVKTAAGAGVKNVVDSCQLTTTAFGASVPLAFRDGAGGTVRWALTVPTAGFLQPVLVVFKQPFVTTANTLLEVATTTANTSGTVTLNCQGHTE